MKPAPDSVAYRLDKAAEQAGKTLKELSLAAGKNHAYLQQYINRGTPRVLPEDVRATLAAELGGEPDDYKEQNARPSAPRITGVGPASEQLAGTPLPQSQHAPRDEVVVLSMYDVNASAGPGSIVEDGEPIGYYPISLSLLQSITRAPAEMVGVIQVRGNSMEPDLKHGDLIFVDRSVTSVAGDFAYVLDRGGYLQVKYLVAQHKTKTVKIISKNETFPEDEAAEEDLAIAGKVVAIFRGIG